MTKLSQINNFLKINFIKNSNYKPIVICLCIGFFCLNILSLLWPLPESITYDEWPYFNSGRAVLDGKPFEAEVKTFRDSNPNVMPVSALNVLVSKAIPVPTLSKLTGIKIADRMPFGKLATIIASVVLAIYVFRWSFQLYGLYAAFLALALYILDPSIIAHSRIITQDLFGACAIFIATYYFWKLLKFGGRKNKILSILTFALAQICRYTSVYLAPIYLVLFIGFYGSSIINLIKEKQFRLILARSRDIVVYITLLLVTTLIIINIGFAGEKTFTKFGDYQFKSRAFSNLQASSPILRALPVPVPYAYVRGLDFGKSKEEIGAGSGLPYLRGKLGVENGKIKGFKDYYIVTFIYKVPIATQLILLSAVVLLIRNRNKINFWQNEAFLIIPPLVYLIIFSIAISSQLGIRYILMIFPFLFVLASKVAESWTQAILRDRILISSLLAYLLISNLSYYPHYISYFNEFIVDRKFAYKILADSNIDWGQNEYYLQAYLKKHPNAIVEPNQPQSGLVVVGINKLVGILSNPECLKSKPECFKWIREKLEPVDHVAYSYLVFDVKPEDLPK